MYCNTVSWCASIYSMVTNCEMYDLFIRSSWARYVVIRRQDRIIHRGSDCWGSYFTVEWHWLVCSWFSIILNSSTKTSLDYFHSVWKSTDFFGKYYRGGEAECVAVFVPQLITIMQSVAHFGGYCFATNGSYRARIIFNCTEMHAS